MSHLFSWVLKVILFPEFDQDLEQVDWENLIVTLLMTSFFVIKNQLQHFTKLTALEKLNLRDYGGGCLFKSQESCHV